MGTPFPPGQQPHNPQQPHQGQQPYPGQPGQAPYPGSPAQGQKPKRRLLKTGLVMMVLGAVLGTVFGVLAFIQFPKPADFPRTTGPESSVELTAGEWTVFQEGFSQGAPPVIQAPTGEAVAINPISTSQTYDFGSNSGIGVGKIQAPVDGQYLVTTGSTVAFAQGFASSLVWAIGLILAAVFVGGGLLVIGGILALIGALRR